MGFFRKLFSPLKSRFKKMDTLMQNRVAIPVTLAGFAQRAAENELLPKLLTVLGTAISPEIKKKIATELAIGVVACVRIPDKRVLTDVWGLEGEALRQMVAMLVFSESADSRQVLENAKYSSNPDEARVQVLLSIIRLVGIKDDTLITRINTQAFGKEWNGFATEFVDGAITGFNRAQRAVVIESVAGKLESLSPRGQALIEELVNRLAKAPAKPLTYASSPLSPIAVTEEIALQAYAKMLNTLSTEPLESLLAEDFIYESQTITKPIDSKQAFLSYMTQWLQTIAQADAPVYAEMGSVLAYGKRQPCVILAQHDKLNLVGLVLAKVETNKLKRLDLCIVPPPQAAERSGEYPT